MAQDKNGARGVGEALVRAPQNGGNLFVTTRETRSFSKRTLIHGVIQQFR